MSLEIYVVCTTNRACFTDFHLTLILFPTESWKLVHILLYNPLNPLNTI